MESLNKILSIGFEIGQKAVTANDKRFEDAEKRLEAFVERAKLTLTQKSVINPKPQKRFARVIEQDSLEEGPEPIPQSVPYDSPDKSLRPLRTAKDKANQNLKEVPANSKMRNDNNKVFIKQERSSSIRGSTESIKENKVPEMTNKPQTDQVIQATSSDLGATFTSKKSDSVEIICAKTVEVDITSDVDVDKMPPPAIPKKIVKKTRTKQIKAVDNTVPEVPPNEPLRITRSKIKTEKVSVDRQASKSTVDRPLSSNGSTNTVESNFNETAPAKKGTKKKYPMPILIKMEPTEEPKITKKVSKPVKSKSVEKKTSQLPESPAEPIETKTVDEPMCNETFNIAPTVNETVTYEAGVANETITLAKSDNVVEKNPHDSLMTEDNDEENQSSEDVPIAMLKQPTPSALPQLKLKNNVVFNPYDSSPVKQRVQAFEKHVIQATPEKFKSKINTLTKGTPSKFLLYTKTTPLSLSKTQRFTSSATSSGYKAPRQMKNNKSLSQEALEDGKKVVAAPAAQSIEEKRKLREEKIRQAQLQREALEKETREKAIKMQQEREDKYRKVMKDKEEKQRMEALKKQLLKEKQAKKFAEEKAKKEKFLMPKAVAEPSAGNHDESLRLRMQKQMLLEKTAIQKKEDSKNTYSFDMLHTDDSTDDEEKPSKKRPPIPTWSKKSTRKPLISMQSHTSTHVLDAFFSTKPITVDLREIFPGIDSRKLVRNSSAVWRTPPKHY